MIQCSAGQMFILSYSKHKKTPVGCFRRAEQMLYIFFSPFFKKIFFKLAQKELRLRRHL